MLCTRATTAAYRTSEERKTRHRITYSYTAVLIAINSKTATAVYSEYNCLMCRLCTVLSIAAYIILRYTAVVLTIVEKSCLGHNYFNTAFVWLVSNTKKFTRYTKTCCREIILRVIRKHDTRGMAMPAPGSNRRNCDRPTRRTSKYACIRPFVFISECEFIVYTAPQDSWNRVPRPSNISLR